LSSDLPYIMTQKPTPAKKTVIVTGGTAGIGLAIAEALLDSGHSVFICGRDAQRLDTALERLQVLGSGRVDGVVCDVRDLDSVTAMTDAALERFGRINALVNSAGMAFIMPFDQIQPQQWRDIIDTNLSGVFNCCHAVIPLLKSAGGGDIVNLGSRSGRYAFSGGVGYNTTKFGLQGFSEALFLDVHKYGIRVSLVAPGTVGTGLGGTTPQDWHLQPEDVAYSVLSVLEADQRAAVSWVEIRPARPPT
jgi:NAD(P)-dependent dehydrogenase (short-subunit alcohol dehydrogenase family)